MNENRHPIDDLFRDGLSQHSVEPPMHVWERIDQTRTPVYKLMNNFKQNSRWYLSIAAGLALMSSAAIMYLADEPQKGLAIEANGVAPQMEMEAGNVQSPSEGTKSLQSHEYEGTANTVTPPTSNANPSGTQGHRKDLSPTEENTKSPSVKPTPGTSGGITPPVYSEFGTEKREKPEVVVPEYHAGTPTLTPPAQEAKQIDPPLVVQGDEVPETAPSSAPEKVEDKTLIPVTPSPWSLELLASYDFMNRSLQNADPAYVKARKDAEKLGAAYTLQLRAQYRLNDVIALRSGISFSQNFEKLNYTRTEQSTEIVERQETGYILDPINGPTAITYMVRDTFNHSTSTNYNSNNSYTFIDIPVLLNYTVYTSNKWNLGVSGGPMFNLAFSQKGRILGPNNNEVIDLNSPSNPFRSYAGVNLMLNVSASYKLNKNFDLLFEPGMRYGITSLTNKNFGIAQRYSSVNLFTGLRYNF